MKNSRKFLGIIVFSAMLMVLLAAPRIFNNAVVANGQETCPNTGGDWVKKDGLASLTYNYDAPDGKVIVATCYKAGNSVVHAVIDPPKLSVLITSEVLNPTGNAFQNLSHASFKLADEAKETQPPTEEPTQPPTEEPTQPPTEEPTKESTPEPTKESTPDPTEEPETGSTPRSVSDPEVALQEVELSYVCLGDGRYQWTAISSNSSTVNFSYLANNGEVGSGQIPANGEASFITSGEANEVTLTYTLEQESLKVSGKVIVCQQTSSADPQPDEPAGGSGPSILSILTPLLIGASSLSAISILVVKGKKILIG